MIVTSLIAASHTCCVIGNVLVPPGGKVAVSHRSIFVVNSRENSPEFGWEARYGGESPDTCMLL
jgi:hypothetical protein